MLKLEVITDSETRHLNNKMFCIHFTNVCNLSCGGCDHFCGHFKNIWFISQEEFDRNIASARRYIEENWGRDDFPEEDKVVNIFGGEPTLHPQFDRMLETMYRHDDIPFVVCTNGRSFSELLSHVDLEVSSRDISRQVYMSTLPKSGYGKFQELFRRFHSHDKNVAYRIDYKTPEVRDKFCAVLVAPCDVERDYNPDGRQYWKRAKHICYKWKSCENCIYRDKVYVCNVAGPMDELFYGGKYGWTVEKGRNPFSRSPKEIEDQMKHFCYRCGYCFDGGMKGFDEVMETTQYIHKKMMATVTNCNEKMELVDVPTQRVPPEVFR
jgi:organic radical activating enzyme